MIIMSSSEKRPGQNFLTICNKQKRDAATSLFVLTENNSSRKKDIYMSL